MEIKITANDKEVISSGVFLTKSEKNNIIEIKKGKETIILDLKFEDTEDKKIQAVIGTVGEAKGDKVKLELVLKNFNNAGLIEPLHLATFDNGDEVFLDFWTVTLGKESPTKEIIYSIYLNKKNG